jgi:acyl-[acyl-carrier-protein]-phospholipid O-acyltransferase/long-chain-fatty-acid--[acyl-carrier-protein] ligase
LRWFPKIRIQILPPTRIAAPGHLKGKERRKYSGHLLADIMIDMMFVTSHYRRTIFSALLEARQIHGGRHLVIEDLERKPLSYDDLITRTIALGNAFTGISEREEAVGVLLPNSTNTLGVILGLQLHGRVPAMLNFSTGSAAMLSACNTARVKTVLTSRRFIEKGKLTEEAEQLSRKVTLVYLEDLAGRIGRRDKYKAWLQSRTAGFWYKDRQFHPDNPAVILFTSGSEGTPKGVVLSHSNILANLKQLEACINFNPQDIVLNFLRIYGGHDAAGSKRNESVFLPDAAPLQHHSRNRLRNQSDDHVRHQYLSRRLRQESQPLRFFQYALCRGRRRKAPVDDTQSLGRQIRHPHSRRLRRYRNDADRIGQYADVL